MKYIIFIIVAGLIIWAAMVYRPGAKSEVTEPNTINNETTTMPAGLKIEDVKIGTGAEAAVGQSVTVHYVGTLENGTKFDSSRDRGAPATFGLNRGGLIEGWILGIPGMKVGGIRKLTIAPELGYGARAQGAIPANSTLLFEVELLGVK